VPDPTNQRRRVAIAIAAHPDDIEFMMAGTLMLLRQAGWETHTLNISSGNCGSVSMGAEKIEAKRLAKLEPDLSFEQSRDDLLGQALTTEAEINRHLQL